MTQNRFPLMTDRLDLPDRYRSQVEALLAANISDSEAWAYGSRVNGRNHQASDLDVVLRGPALEPIPSNRLRGLEEAFEHSNIPIIVRIHDWARLPESFREAIQKQYAILQGPPVLEPQSTATVMEVRQEDNWL